MNAWQGLCVCVGVCVRERESESKEACDVVGKDFTLSLKICKGYSTNSVKNERNIYEHNNRNQCIPDDLIN